MRITVIKVHVECLAEASLAKDAYFIAANWYIFGHISAFFYALCLQFALSQHPVKALRSTMYVLVEISDTLYTKIGFYSVHCT